LSAQETAEQADLTRHKEHFPNINGPGLPLLAVNRIYDELDGKVDSKPDARQDRRR
jgi:hypothetical protein